MRVQDLMSRTVVTIGESESCHRAVERMAAARIRHLPVVDGAGRLVGIVTDRDLRHHAGAPLHAARAEALRVTRSRRCS